MEKIQQKIRSEQSDMRSRKKQLMMKRLGLEMRLTSPIAIAEQRRLVIEIRKRK